MSLLTDIQTAAASFISSVNTLVTQAGYLVGVITGPESGSSSIVDTGTRQLKTLARLELEILASRAFDPKGAYSNATTYAKLEAVSYGGIAYVSMQDGNLNHQPDTSPTWWMQLVSAQIVVSSSAPSNVVDGMIWVDPSVPIMLVRYSGQWIELS